MRPCLPYCTNQCPLPVFSRRLLCPQKETGCEIHAEAKGARGGEVRLHGPPEAIAAGECNTCLLYDTLSRRVIARSTNSNCLP